MLHPHDLFPTAIININGLPTVISGILPPEPQEDKRFSDKWVVITPLSNVPLDECEGIPLTEKILTEWCWFEKSADSFGGFLSPEFGGGRIRVNNNQWYSGINNVELTHPHHLQMLVQSLTNNPLKIEIK